jgi:hypothetical protein
MTTAQFDDLMQGLKLLAVEMRATRQLVTDAIADIGDLQVRIAALDMRFDE